VLKIEDTTRTGYERLIRLHIRPVLGSLSIGRVNGETTASRSDLGRTSADSPTQR
jgi:hypothetical protein